MKRLISAIMMTVMMTGCSSKVKDMDNIYQFTVADNKGNEVCLDEYRGKVITSLHLAEVQGRLCQIRAYCNQGCARTGNRGYSLAGFSNAKRSTQNKGRPLFLFCFCRRCARRIYC